MIEASPFPYADLTESRGRESRAQVQGEAFARGAVRDEEKFFRSFRPDSKTASEPECLYTAEDLAEAVDEARRTAAHEAEAKLRDAMTDDLDRRRVDLLAAIRDQLGQHRSAFETELRDLADVSRGLGLALAETLIPRALERQPLADVAELLRSTLVRLTEEPSIELRLPPDLVESGEELLAEIVRDVGFPGGVATVADVALGQSDAELRWRGGAVERRTDRLLAEARDLVQRWLPSSSETEEGVEAMPPAGMPEAPALADPSDSEPDPGSEHE